MKRNEVSVRELSAILSFVALKFQRKDAFLEIVNAFSIVQSLSEGDMTPEIRKEVDRIMLEQTLGTSKVVVMEE